MSSEGDIVDIDDKPTQKRSHRKKAEQSLDDIFSSEEDIDNFMKVQ